MSRKLILICALMASVSHIQANKFTDAATSMPKGKDAAVGFAVMLAAGLAKQYLWDNMHEGQHRSLNPVVAEARDANETKGSRAVVGAQVGGASATMKVPTEGSFQDMLDNFAPYVSAGVRPKYDKSVAQEEREAVGRQRSAYVEVGLGPSCKVEVRESVSNGVVGLIAMAAAWIVKAGVQARK